MKIRRAKNAKKRLNNRIKGYEESVSKNSPSYERSVKKPGSMKK